MPSKKQRRRRQKERRHEYEVVYVDSEGRELDPSEVETEAPRERKKDAAVSTRAGRSAGQRPSGAVRPVPPPSWRRVLKRAAIFSPFMLITISLLGSGLTWTARVLETLWLLALFVPFSYVVDRMMFRRYLRQTGQPPPAQRQRRA